MVFPEQCFICRYISIRALTFSSSSIMREMHTECVPKIFSIGKFPPISLAANVQIKKLIEPDNFYYKYELKRIAQQSTSFNTKMYKPTKTMNQNKKKYSVRMTGVITKLQNPPLRRKILSKIEINKSSLYHGPDTTLSLSTQNKNPNSLPICTFLFGKHQGCIFVGSIPILYNK